MKRSLSFNARYLNGDMLKIGNGYSSVWNPHCGYIMQAVPNDPNPTSYRRFFRYPTRFSFKNSQVTGNPKYWVLLKIVGIIQYFG